MKSYLNCASLLLKNADRRIFKEHLLAEGVSADHIIEIALDGIESEELRDPKICYKYIKDHLVDDERFYILIHEVQFMPRFEEVLNSLLRIHNVDVYVTGSNSKFLSSDIVTEFRGRGTEIRIYPLSFAEFYSVYGGDYDDAWEEYMRYGSLPIIPSLKTEKHMSYTNKTISKHIDYLAEAFLISKVNRFDIKGRRYIGTNLKYYFTDIGLRNARLNFRQQEPAHIMENIVYNELLIRGLNVDVGVVEVNAKNNQGQNIRKQLEVDFVVNKGSQRYYIQVAYDMTSGEKQEQEFNSIKHISDSFKKIVIVNGSMKPWRNEEGFVIMGMKYFLFKRNLKLAKKQRKECSDVNLFIGRGFRTA